jgi:DNA-binding NarL/FixJ family response regulator
MCNGAVTVLVSDANPMGCQLLANALRNSDQHFKVVACAVDSRTVVNAANEHQPSVALISLNLKDGPLSGLEALREMRRSKPGVSSVMLLEQRQHDHLVDSFRGGAKGVFFRTAPFEALCKCIEKVHEGQIWASSDELQIILEAFAKAMPLRTIGPKPEGQLTKREEQVVHLVSQGLSNREISSQLNLSAHTVKNYLFHIFDKLGVSSRVELVLHSSPQSGPAP